MDGVLPAGLLKGGLPVIHAGNQVLAPLFGSCWIYIVDDWLDWLHQLSPLLPFNVFRLGLQTPAADEAEGFHALLVIAKDGVAIGKEAYAGVEHTGLHWLFRQEEEGGVYLEGDGAGGGSGREARALGSAAGSARLGVVRICLGNGYLCIDWIGTDAGKECGVPVKGSKVVLALCGRTQGEHLGVVLEQAVDLDAGTVGAAFLRFEGGHYRIL